VVVVVVVVMTCGPHRLAPHGPAHAPRREWSSRSSNQAAECFGGGRPRESKAEVGAAQTLRR
jgi:hypothetical protein